MNVILYEAVPNLGSIGDQVRVKPGYARNYLIPQGKAVPATPDNLAQMEARRAELERQEAELRAVAEEKAQKVDGLTLRLVRKAGEEGKLFGSVGTIDLVEAIAEHEVEVSRHDILLPNGPMRELGEFEVDIRLHPHVECKVNVHIVAE